MSNRDGLVRRPDFIGIELTDGCPPRRRSCLVSAFPAFWTPRGGVAACSGQTGEARMAEKSGAKCLQSRLSTGRTSGQPLGYDSSRSRGATVST
eukprot:6563823-Pyramimonas_sp.AAC.1